MGRRITNIGVRAILSENLLEFYPGPPELMTMHRPVYSLTKSTPGTEPIAEAAAALGNGLISNRKRKLDSRNGPKIAAGSIIFKEIDEEYSNRALGHALELFEFGDKFRKEYHWSIPQVTEFYKSWSGYKDELCWAATWVYRATQLEVHKTKAEGYFKVSYLELSQSGYTNFAR